MGFMSTTNFHAFTGQDLNDKHT